MNQNHKSPAPPHRVQLTILKSNRKQRNQPLKLLPWTVSMPAWETLTHIEPGRGAEQVGDHWAADTMCLPFFLPGPKLVHQISAIPLCWRQWAKQQQVQGPTYRLPIQTHHTKEKHMTSPSWTYGLGVYLRVFYMYRRQQSEPGQSANHRLAGNCQRRTGEGCVAWALAKRQTNDGNERRAALMVKFQTPSHQRPHALGSGWSGFIHKSWKEKQCAACIWKCFRPLWTESTW